MSAKADWRNRATCQVVMVVFAAESRAVAVRGETEGGAGAAAARVAGETRILQLSRER